MTKRLLYALMIAASVAVMLVVAVVPHHHHSSAVCWVVELCEQDGAVNDPHTAHAAHSEEHLVGEVSNVALPPLKSSFKSLAVAGDHYPPYPLQPCTLAGCLNGDAGFAAALFAVVALRGNRFVCCYQSCAAVQSHGLRAPPIIS